jgi:hypothetical protein
MKREALGGDEVDSPSIARGTHLQHTLNREGLRRSPVDRKAVERASLQAADHDPAAGTHQIHGFDQRADRPRRCVDHYVESPWTREGLSHFAEVIALHVNGCIDTELECQIQLVSVFGQSRDGDYVRTGGPCGQCTTEASLAAAQDKHAGADRRACMRHAHS